VGPDVKTAGGRFVEVPVDQVYVEGNFVTAPAWPAHPAWLAAFLKVLGTRIEP
jgi:protease I